MALLKVMQRSRPKRTRAEPDRFGYKRTSSEEEATPTTKRRRRRNSENRNIDQYSSDDEFVGAATTRRPKKVGIFKVSKLDVCSIRMPFSLLYDHLAKLGSVLDWGKCGCALLNTSI